MSGWDEVQDPRIIRDRWGRPMIKQLPDLQRLLGYTRATTEIETIPDTFYLSQYKSRMAVAGIALVKEFYVRAAALGGPPPKMIKDQSGAWVDNARFKEWRSDMNELVEKAQEHAGISLASELGLGLHELAERADITADGDLGFVPTDYIGHLGNYLYATEGWHHLHIEDFMVLDQLQIGGTPDRISKVPGFSKPVISDLKTGDIDFFPLKIAMQEAIYAHSQLYDATTGERTDVDVDLDTGLIIHLHAITGQVAVWECDIATGWEAVQTAHQVRKWRKVKNVIKLYHAPRAKDVAKAWRGKANLDQHSDLELITALRTASTPEELVMIFRSVHPQAWTAEHTQFAKDRKQQLLGAQAFGMDQDQTEGATA